MPFAIELYFENGLDSQVRDACRRISEATGVVDRMHKASRPHVSLAVFEEGDLPALRDALAALAKAHWPFGLRLEAVASFPGEEGVLFLAPAASRALIDIHRDCHILIAGLIQNMWSYYRVDHLTFHCTLNMPLSQDEISRSFAAARALNLPFYGQVTHMGLVKFPEVELLWDFPLGN